MSARRWRLPASARRRIGIPFFFVVGLVLFLTVGWPGLQRTQHNDRRIQRSHERVEALTRLASAGAWFEAAALDWEPEQRRQYDALFPNSKQREELFLSLAQVAVRAGVDPCALREIPMPIEVEEEGGDEDDMMMDDEGALEMLAWQFATDVSDRPSARLHTFRLQARFVADYERMARFLEEMRQIHRALTVHKLTATSIADGIDVDLELEFYVQSSH